MNKKIFHFIVLVTMLYLVSCAKNKENNKQKNTSETSKVNKNKTNLNKSNKFKTERYALLFRDFKGIPLPIFKSSKGKYIVTYNSQNKIQKIIRNDSEGVPFQKWKFIYQNKDLQEVHFINLLTSNTSKIILSYDNNKTCVNFYNNLNLKTEKSCFKSVKKLSNKNIESYYYDMEKKLITKALITPNQSGITTFKITFTKLGAKKYTEFFNLIKKNNRLIFSYKKVLPLGAVETFNEVEYDNFGRQVRIEYKYENGATKSKTTYTYDDKYRTHGIALTEEGIKYKLKVRINNFGHRLLEQRYSGSNLVYEENSKYSNKGKLLERIIKEKSKEVYHLKNIYDQNGLIVQKTLYQGNNYKLICKNNNKQAMVTTLLPALETVKVKYDALGRVNSLTRFYLDKQVDKENLTYTSENHIESKTLYLGNGKIPIRQTYVYDKRGNIIEERSYSGNKLTEIAKYQWNNRGLLVEKKILNPDGSEPDEKNAPGGSIIKYFYNEAGQLKEERRLYSNGKLALSAQIEGCVSCKSAKFRAVSRITWEYKNNLLQKSTEFDPQNKKTYESMWQYNNKGRVVLHEENWYPEQKKKIEKYTYAAGGWVSKVEFSRYKKNKQIFKEERFFEKTHLTEIKRYKKETLVYNVTREYKNGWLHKRRVWKFKKTRILETIFRDASGNPLKSIVTDKNGKSAINEDIFKNKYSELYYSYDDKGIIRSVIRKISKPKLNSKTIFAYDKQLRPIGRKIYENGKLKMEISESFVDPLLGKYGIATLQTRITIRKNNKRKMYMYQIFPDTKNLEKSHAIIKNNGKNIELKNCKCQGCGVTLSLEDFMNYNL